MASIDKEKAEQAVRDLLTALGQDIELEGFKDTPKRVAQMFVEQCSSEEGSLDKSFTQEFDDMVIVRDIPFVSFCQHHLLPYFGRAHVAYIPHKKVLGLSKLVRLVSACSKGFTIQEGVTKDIADKLYVETSLRGCMVVIEAEHGCMNLRGARSIGASTLTSAVRGLYRDVPAARQEFLTLVTKGGPR